MAEMRIIGRKLTSQEVVFKEQFSLDAGEGFDVDVSTLQRYDRIQLEFKVQFTAAIIVEAQARVAQLAGISVYRSTEKRVEANISHELSKGKAAPVAYMNPGTSQGDCLLHCPLTGKRSTGPCIDCSDEDYTIRLCC